MCVIVKAPSSMKSVVLAAWLLTTACGNLIDVVVTGTRVITQVSFTTTLSLPTIASSMKRHISGRRQKLAY